jgi:hypothetical protein
VQFIATIEAESAGDAVAFKVLIRVFDFREQLHDV